MKHEVKQIKQQQQQQQLFYIVQLNVVNQSLYISIDRQIHSVVFFLSRSLFTFLCNFFLYSLFIKIYICMYNTYLTNIAD